MRECRVISGASAVNTCVHTHYPIAHTGLRVHWAPGVPHALCLKRADEFSKNLGRIRAAERERMFESLASLRAG